MARPGVARFVCQIAVGQTWNQGGWTWTDVTPFLRSFDLSRGRTYELDTFEPAEASFVFANSSG